MDAFPSPLDHDPGPGIGASTDQRAGHAPTALPGATGRNVDQLVNQGLINRQEDPRDRRIKRVSLTQQGRAQVARALTVKRASMSAFLDRLEPDDHARLLAALAPILARIEPAPRL